MEGMDRGTEMVAEMGSEKAIGCHTRVGRRGFRGLEAIRGSFGKRSGDVKVRGTRAGATRKKMAVRGRGVRGGGTEPRNGKGGRRRAEGGRIDDRGWSGQGGAVHTHSKGEREQRNDSLHGR